VRLLVVCWLCTKLPFSDWRHTVGTSPTTIARLDATSSYCVANITLVWQPVVLIFYQFLQKCFSHFWCNKEDSCAGNKLGAEDHSQLFDVLTRASHISVMDFPALQTILFLNWNGLARLQVSTCWHRNVLCMASVAGPWHIIACMASVAGPWHIIACDVEAIKEVAEWTLSSTVILCNELSSSCGCSFPVNINK